MINKIITGLIFAVYLIDIASSSSIFISTNVSKGNNLFNNHNNHNNRLAPIHNGHVAHSGKFQYHVIIQVQPSKNERFTYQCGGVILSKYYVATAGHCVMAGNKPYPAASVNVVGGSVSTRSSYMRRFKVRKVTVHENYTLTYDDYDIAILTLSSQLPLNKKGFKAIKINKQPVKVNTKCLISGFGIHGPYEVPRPKPGHLYYTYNFVIGNKECQEMLPRITITPRKICMGYWKGGKKTSVCLGDSGGPAVCNSLLVGIITWARNDDCEEPHRVSVFADVANLSSWIESKMT